MTADIIRCLHVSVCSLRRDIMYCTRFFDVKRPKYIRSLYGLHFTVISMCLSVDTSAEPRLTSNAILVNPCVRQRRDSFRWNRAGRLCTLITAFFCRYPVLPSKVIRPLDKAGLRRFLRWLLMMLTMRPARRLALNYYADRCCVTRRCALHTAGRRRNGSIII